MIYIYIYLFVFQLLNTYLGVLTPLNPYVFSVLLIVYGVAKKMHKTNLKILAVLALSVITCIFVYTVKFSLLSSFSITAKAIQFNFGYLFLIPGFTVFFKLVPKIKMVDILKATFWTISIEIFIEFVLIRILGVSPGAFTHYPKLQHIIFDPLTGIYTAYRLLGLTGNASVTGVLLSAIAAIYLGYLFEQEQKLLTKKTIPVIVSFFSCFFMIISGSAFFAIMVSLLIIWAQRKGSLGKNLMIAAILVPSIAIFFNYLATVTDAFGEKFTTKYLLLLLQTEDMPGSLPFVLKELSREYHWYNFFVGTYTFEWGNASARIKTVDFFFVNLVFEFGLLGLWVLVYAFRVAYKAVKKMQVVNNLFLQFGFLVVFIGSMHYPSIAYTATQVFLSAIAGIALRDYNINFKKQPAGLESGAQQNKIA